MVYSGNFVSLSTSIFSLNLIHNTLHVCVSRWQQVPVGAAQSTTMMCMRASPAACPAFTTTSGENQFPVSLLLWYNLNLVPSRFIHWKRTKADPGPLDNNEKVQTLCEKHWDECAFWPEWAALFLVNCILLCFHLIAFNLFSKQFQMKYQLYQFVSLGFQQLAKPNNAFEDPVNFHNLVTKVHSLLVLIIICHPNLFFIQETSGEPIGLKSAATLSAQQATLNIALNMRPKL